MQTKTCSKCRLVKPVQAFRRNGKYATYRPACRDCEAAARKALIPPPPPSAPPLETAHQEAANARAKRDLKAEHSALVEENVRLHAEVATFTQVKHAPFEILVYGKSKDLRADAIACALFSDWHIEEPVEAASVHDLNEYNLEVAKLRMKAAFQNYLKLALMLGRDSDIKTLYMGWLGDFFSGWIHEELIANTLLAPGDAAVFANEMLCSGVEFLLRESSFNILVDAIPGNHGRLTHKMHFGDPTGTSLETVMYHMIASRYSKNKRVQINVSAHSEVHRTFFENYRVRLIHGYETSYQGGVGGLTIPLNKWIWRANSSKHADLTCLGHYHQFLDGGKFLANGSGIGYNNYAKVKGFAYEEPSQAFFLIHARKGGQKTVVAPIWLDTKDGDSR